MLRQGSARFLVGSQVKMKPDGRRHAVGPMNSGLSASEAGLVPLAVRLPAKRLSPPNGGGKGPLLRLCDQIVTIFALKRGLHKAWVL